MERFLERNAIHIRLQQKYAKYAEKHDYSALYNVSTRRDIFSETDYRIPDG
jgi:hypothetical protein